MGTSQSQETSQPEVIRINRDEIPEQYRTVGVSNDVVKRVSSQQGSSPGENGEETRKLRAELDRERAEKSRLRDEMAKLSELQARRPATGYTSLAEDIEERKKIFNETVERVEKEFFSYQRENVCSENEQQIMSCLGKNKGKVLKCGPLADAYEKCVSDFRAQVLSGK